jgi:hypothetical protein
MSAASPSESVREPTSDHDRERRKQELRVRLEAERQLSLRAQTVVPPKLQNVFERPTLLLSEGEDARPARPIAAKDVAALNVRFGTMLSPEPGSQLDEAFEIGFRLRSWHDLFASETHWVRWRNVNITIAPRWVNQCICLWDANERIKFARAKTGKPETLTEALRFISGTNDRLTGGIGGMSLRRRKCPDCGLPIGPRKRYCQTCARRHKRESDRTAQRKARKTPLDVRS